MSNQFKGKYFSELGLNWPENSKAGVINDHVQVQYVGDSAKEFAAYIRENYDALGGPKPKPAVKENITEFRCWRNVTIVVRDASFEEALEIGRKAAASQGLALYVQKLDGKGPFIDDCPDSWTPRVG